MPRPTPLLLALAMAALSLGLAACAPSGGGGSDESATLDLVIGDLAPPGGSGGKTPGELASDEINASIKESGADHTVEVAQGADGQKLVDTDGATCLASAEPGDPVAGAASAHTAPGANVEAPALASDVESSLHGAQDKVVTVTQPDSPEATAFADYFQRAWEDKGGTIGDSNPDATVAESSTALVNSHIDPATIFVPPALATPELLSTGPIEGLGGVLPAIPEDTDASTEFLKLLPDADAKAFPAPAAQAQDFDAVIICYLAAVAAGSTDGAEIADEIPDVTAPEGDEFTWQQLADAVDALENGDDIDYVGASGQIDMDVNGDPTVGTYDPFQIKNGEITADGDQITAEAIEG